MRTESAMGRDPSKDILKNPTPTAGASKKTVDGVLTALKIGNGAVSLLAGLLAAVLILYSGYVLYDSFSTEYQAYSSSWDLLKYKPIVLNDEPTEGAETLAAINEDYRAWLTIYDTTIDYPVVQGENDLYYASHDIYKETSLTGAIYLAAGNKANFSDSYNLIYGHHMDNGAMFGSLDKFKDETYFQAHQEGIIVTKDGIYDITLFGAASTDAYESQIYSVGNRAAEVIAFLTGERKNDVGVGTKNLIWDEKAAEGAAKVIALSTCADAETNGRLVVFGKMTLRKRSSVSENDETSASVKLTVRYQGNDGELFPAEVFTYASGDPYYIVVPQKAGYDAEVEILRGTITGDMEIVIRYTPKTYKMTIQYIYMDGSKAAKTYTADVVTGERTEVTSPEIADYVPLRLKVSETNSGRDEQYTVIYVPEDEYDSLMTIDDYETATNLEVTYVQTGICLE